MTKEGQENVKQQKHSFSEKVMRRKIDTLNTGDSTWCEIYAAREDIEKKVGKIWEHINTLTERKAPEWRFRNYEEMGGRGFYDEKKDKFFVRIISGEPFLGKEANEAARLSFYPYGFPARLITDSNWDETLNLEWEKFKNATDENFLDNLTDLIEIGIE